MIASPSWYTFLGWKSMIWIPRFTTSQRCAIGLRSGNRGDHLSTGNSLTRSWNQFEIICANDVLSSHQMIGIKKHGHGQKQYSTRPWHLNNAWLFQRSPKSAMKTPPHVTKAAAPCLLVLYTKFWRYHLKVTAETDSLNQAIFFKSSVVQFRWTHANCFQFLADVSLLLKPIWIEVLYIHRRFSAYCGNR